MKRVGTLGVTQLDYDIAVEKGLYYYQSNDFVSEIIFSVSRLAEPLKDHIDNNFNPLNANQRNDFSQMTAKLTDFVSRCAHLIGSNNYGNMYGLVHESAQLTEELIALKRAELKRIQGQSGSSTKVSMVYLNMVQEAQNIVSFTCNLIKVSRKFQKEWSGYWHIPKNDYLCSRLDNIVLIY